MDMKKAMRDNLIALLVEAAYKRGGGPGLCEYMADHLIANGVTAAVECFECDADHMTSNEKVADLVKQLRKHGLSNGSSLGHHSGLYDAAADMIETLLIERDEAVRRA